MLGELTPCGGGPPIPLLQPKLLLGRHPACDISLPFATISSHHCELELRDGSWFVRDLGSRNRTHVNGVACESKRLTPGDIVSFARHRYKILFKVQGEQPAPDPDDEVVRFEQSLLEKVGLGAKSAATNAGVGKSRESTKSLGDLVPCGGGPPIPLLKSKLLVGRHPNCDLVLGFPSVSLHHCELEYRDGFWFVRDLRSRNGIRVDGKPCESERLLPKNVLSISTHRYRLSYQPSAEDEAMGLNSDVFGMSLLEKAGLAHGRSDLRDRPEQARVPRGNQLDHRRDRDEPRQRWNLDEDF